MIKLFYPKPIVYLLSFLVFIACTGFAYGIFEACRITLKHCPDASLLMPSFLASVVTSISAVLATNLGVVLGITFAHPASKFRDNRNWNPLTLFSANTNPTVLQTCACYIYVAGLVAAAIVWAINGFEQNDKEVVSLIPELTKSLLGIIVGALAAALNVPTTNSVQKNNEEKTRV